MLLEFTKIEVKIFKINEIEIRKNIKLLKLYFDFAKKEFLIFLNKFVFKFGFILFINKLYPFFHY